MTAWYGNATFTGSASQSEESGGPAPEDQPSRRGPSRNAREEHVALVGEAQRRALRRVQPHDQLGAEVVIRDRARRRVVRRARQRYAALEASGQVEHVAPGL